MGMANMALQNGGSALFAIALCLEPLPLSAKSDKAASEAIVTGMNELAPLSHASNGSDRAQDGKPRFTGPMGAQAVSYKGWQYVIYYTGRDRSQPQGIGSSDVVIARRKLGGFKWQRSTLKGYRVISDDAHNRQTIGIASGDGTIHIAFDHHNQPQMNYAVTAKGVADDPGKVKWDDSVFRYAPNLGGDPTEKLEVTYPSFKPFPGGNMIVYFRSGGSYGGEMRVGKYDAATGKWGKVHSVSSRHGTYRGLKTTRGPYLGGMQVSGDGVLQMAWLFRERPCDYTTESRIEAFCNHGIFYAKSKDEGRTWLRADGSLIADTDKGEAISIDNIGPPVVEVVKGQGPTNPSIASTVDPANGEMHVLLKHLPTPGAQESIYFHYRGTADGKWSGRQTNFSGNDSTLVMVKDRLYAFIGREKGQIFYADRKDGFRSWKQMSIKGSDGTLLEPSGGFINWDLSNLSNGRVSMLWHKGSDVLGQSTPIWVLDVRL
jgi:BNR repeat-containing family member